MTLTYRDEEDRAYGLAGMILSLGDLGAVENVVSVTLDSEGPMVTFTDNYYHIFSPVVSPKSVWEGVKKNFYLTAAMVVANLMARALVHDRTAVPRQLLNAVYSEIEAEGMDACGLEKDEIQALFDHIVMRSRRLFDNPRVHPAVRNLSQSLTKQRSLSASDLLELLQSL
jgi:p-aminobenzoyl-glutamate transporter AbgT